jgi:hypothetical protein
MASESVLQKISVTTAAYRGGLSEAGRLPDLQCIMQVMYCSLNSRSRYTAILEDSQAGSVKYVIEV